MAVLKYKSGNQIRTLGVVKSGVSGVSSINGKTGAVTGIYDENNQPPYPVKSVNGMTGDVKIATLNNSVSYSVGAHVTAGFSLIYNIPILTAGSLPKGSTMFVTLNTNLSGYSILPVACQTETQGYIQCSCCVRNNGVGMTFTSESFEGDSQPFSARLYVFCSMEFTITGLEV